MSKQTPMLFSAPMICALLDGRKTQTRRLKFTGKVGDLIWVRETWAASPQYDHRAPRNIWVGAPIYYAATNSLVGLRTRSAIHMPRWATRIELRVTAVRSDRLDDISEADAIAEGVCPIKCKAFASVCEGLPIKAKPAQLAFYELWSSIHGEWNPDLVVQVIEFERAK